MPVASAAQNVAVRLNVVVIGNARYPIAVPLRWRPYGWLLKTCHWSCVGLIIGRRVLLILLVVYSQRAVGPCRWLGWLAALLVLCVDGSSRQPSASRR